MIGSLEQFIRFAENSSDVWGIKDMSSRFLYGNRALRELWNLPHGFEIEGLLDSEIPAPTAEFEKEIQALDRLVEVTQEARRSLHIHPWGKGQVVSPYYDEKLPVFGENGEVTGTIFHGHLALDLRFGMDKMGTRSFIFGAPNDTLSKKEWDFVYFVMRGYSVKKMARLSGVSPGTIASRQNSVFNKLGIDTLAQLEQMVMAKGWDNYIPTDLLHNRYIKLW
ncbi:MAG: PAS domain-containing protein [Herbaspirillum sp.]